MSNEMKDWLRDQEEEKARLVAKFKEFGDCNDEWFITKLFEAVCEIEEEYLTNKFFQTDECALCGSQRCDRTKEWVQGCKKWDEYLTANWF